MNINPSAKRILCYGDSNTRGFIPLKNGLERYPVDKRWTGILQKLLGQDYEIIEEGLDARLTSREDFRPDVLYKNSLSHVFPIVASHKPLDLVIIMLGTTDLKEKINMQPEETV